MRRLGEERGFTIVELLVGMLMSLLVFSAVLSLLDTYQHQTKFADERNQVQDAARSTIDAMTRQLRNVAAESPTSAGALERNGPTDVVFQTVSTGSTFGGSNATNQMRVRYCLNTSNASNEVLWTQTETWTTATGPSIPTDSSCPDDTSGWDNNPAYPDRQLVTNITNDINGQSRALFTYAPIGATAPTEINFVEADLHLDVNPGHETPGETQIKSGIYLRNSFAAPTAGMTIDKSTGEVLLNGSSSYDPNGQALTYAWTVNGSPVTSVNPTQCAQSCDAGPASGYSSGTYTFGLTVTSSGGLAGTTSETIALP